MERMLAKLSCRRYPTGLEPMGQAVEATASVPRQLDPLLHRPRTSPAVAPDGKHRPIYGNHGHQSAAWRLT